MIFCYPFLNTLNVLLGVPLRKTKQYLYSKLQLLVILTNAVGRNFFFIYFNSKYFFCKIEFLLILYNPWKLSELSFFEYVYCCMLKSKNFRTLNFSTKLEKYHTHWNKCVENFFFCISS